METEELSRRLEGLTVAEAIKEFLVFIGSGNPSGFHKVFKKIKPTTSYKSICQFFYTLRELGLIRFVREEKSKTPIPKRFYEVVPELVDSHGWWHPMSELYPDVKLGSKGYADLKKKGLKPKGGRRRKYRKKPLQTVV